MRLRCQKIYLSGRRCKCPTHGEDKFCRWHKIIYTFRQDNSKVSEFRHYNKKVEKKAALSHRNRQIGTIFSIIIFGAGIWLFIKNPHLIWILIIIFGFGSGCKLFADSIIALDYPLTQFAFWAKLLTIGMGLELSCGAIIATLLVTMPYFSEALINPLITYFLKIGITINPYLLIIGVGIIATGFAILTIKFQLNIFIQRVLFLEIRNLNFITWFFPFFVTTVAISNVLNLILKDYFPDFSLQLEINFLERILGGNIIISIIIIFIAFYGAFGIAEYINTRMRANKLNIAGFKATIDKSFPVCIGSPIIAIIFSRVFLILIGIIGWVGYFLFLLMTLFISSLLCIIASYKLIQHQIQKTNYFNK